MIVDIEVRDGMPKVKDPSETLLRRFFILKKLLHPFKLDHLRNSSYLLIVLLFIYGCSKPKKNNQAINGYWEIEKITIPNGEEHTYSFNKFIDYLYVIDSLMVFRKKLKPKFNGGFLTTKDTVQLRLHIENDGLYIYYKTAFSSWRETILLATIAQLKTINEDKNVLLYKPYTPMDIK